MLAYAVLYGVSKYLLNSDHSRKIVVKVIIVKIS